MTHDTTNWLIDGSEETMDSRDIIARIEELEASLEDSDKYPEDEFRDMANELEALKALASEAESSPDWNYGETLIRDDYFVTYTGDLIADCYPEVSKVLASSQWPMTCLKIDLKQAARDLKVDYMPVTFNGITYWIRG